VHFITSTEVGPPSRKRLNTLVINIQNVHILKTDEKPFSIRRLVELTNLYSRLPRSTKITRDVIMH
jgi:hypothetical protein